MARKKPKIPDNRIANNKKAFFNYHIEERFEAGLVLQGWEVKAIRAGKANLTEGYVVIRDGELFLIGCQITPLGTASSHVSTDPQRTRKLLMHSAEIERLIGRVEQKGMTLVPLNLHWRRGRVKCEIGLAKGKAQYDKRQTIRERHEKREIQRALKQQTR